MPNYVYNHLTLYGKKKDLLLFYTENKTDNLNLSFRKSVNIEDEEIKNNDEYDLYIKNWGTLWDAFDIEDVIASWDKYEYVNNEKKYKIEYIFYTAWFQPLKWFEKISNKYKKLSGELVYESEDMLFFGKYNMNKGTISKEYEYNREEINDYIKNKINPLEIIKYFNNNNKENIYKNFIENNNLWERIYDEYIVKDIIDNYLEYYKKYIIKLQNMWRIVLSKRKIYKKMIEIELIYLPPKKNFIGGIEYQNRLERFLIRNNLK